MSAGRVHVVGAGLAGLAAAVELAAEGRPVALYEAAAHAGGRCRSFIDAELGVRIDNGNHLLLSGNTAALGYVRRIGALDTFEKGEDSAIPFLDLATGERTAHHFGPGRVPGEFVFVPRHADAPEGEGWVMGYVIDTASDTTELVILDAQDMAAAPVARVHIPHRIPPGFHGNWLVD